jgi:hypothetical protein
VEADAANLKESAQKDMQRIREDESEQKTMNDKKNGFMRN